MFIVPFIVREVPTSILQWKLQPITLFLENRGRGLCSAESPEEWLSVNDITVDTMWVENDICYAKVNPTTTTLADFYSFEQLTKTQTKGTEECWRTFYLLNEVNWDGLIDPKIESVLRAIQKKV